MKKGLFLVLLTIFMMVTIHPLKAHAAETNGWTKRADLPEERLHSSSAVVDGKIFVFGGSSEKSSSNKNTYMYDPHKNEWSSKADMPRKRTDSTAVAIGKKIYVIGGAYRESENTIDIYDAESDKWSEKPILIPSSAVTNGDIIATEENDKIYILATNKSPYQEHNFYSYDTKTDKWQQLKMFPQQFTGMSMSEVINNKIYVTGGERTVSNHKNAHVYEYSIETNQWVQTKSQLKFYQLGAAFTTYQGKLFMAGGQYDDDRSSIISPYTQYYDVMSNSVKKSISKLPEARVGSSAVTLDDTIYIIGGRNFQEYFHSKSIKSDYKSVISISLKDLQIAEGETKPGDGTTEEPKDQNGTKPGDGTTEEPKDQDGTRPGDGSTEEPKDQDGTRPGDGSTEEPKDQDGTKPGDGTTEEPKDQDGTKPGDGTTEEPKDQDGTKPNEEATKGILSITMINGLQKDYLLSMKEINDFLNWYKERSFGIGMNFYEINDEHNKGPFTSKKDYVVYQNILMFDIKQY
ncbi:kelch repeat-containing protein [Bacillus safensis]|uniref:Kelch repeat-containing protein n=1 Tax=Bacillus safensis TaxID=561879 RepID=UPI0024C056CB|nr:kelch repeat-containing protein [Bacillus safensis]WHX76507.1 kelch repeat-containing protein [Bacillus safensis]WHX83965.1 kelch repeat-containing protein [Bacillus safensis]